MAYTRTTWVKNQTPLSATNLNNIESGLEAVDKIVQNLLDKTYPVGSIYMSVNSTNPESIFGGTWEAWGAGRVPVGVNTSDANFSTVEKTGGASTVTLTAAQSGVPAHAHGLNKHVHSLNSHTHSLGSHTHSVSNAQAYVHGAKGLGRKRVASGSSYYTIASSSADDMLYGTTTAAASGNTGASSGNTGAASGNTANNTAANASSAHTNLQPYITCYMFKRTA